jgi:hypothetical protein
LAAENPLGSAGVGRAAAATESDPDTGTVPVVSIGLSLPDQEEI